MAGSERMEGVAVIGEDISPVSFTANANYLKDIIVIICPETGKSCNK